MSATKTLRQVPADREPGQRAPALPPGQLSINEIYFTIQGECGWMGTPTVFVRTSHCPLRCSWCDSQYTFKEGTPRATDDVVAQVKSFPTKHVCLTGGEPLAQAESFRLIERLARDGYTVEVETAGSEDVSPINRLPPRLRALVTINLDVKCPGSAMTNFNRWENLDELRPQDQLKFVLADRGDYDYAKDVLAKHAIPCTAWLHPAWKKLEPSRIAEWVKADGLNVRVGIQLHKYLWGEVRGV
jgi:7-carboxy-7-deazaguanine synthase